MKQCTKCKKLLDESYFNKDKHKKGGLNLWCKGCKNVYYQQHRETQQKIYNQEHKKEMKVQHKIYYQQHREEIKVQQRIRNKVNYHRIVWRNMLDRCNNPNNKFYKDYGGRGIKILYKNFDEFVQDVGDRPTDKHSIDRIYNDGDYKPDNCKWSTAKEQANNRRPKRKHV